MGKYLRRQPREPLGAVLTDDDIERFLLRSGFVAQSVEAVRSTFPRWRAFLLAQGVTRLPSPLSTAPDDAHAVNLLCLLARQASFSATPPSNTR